MTAVTVKGGEMDRAEQARYVAYLQEKYGRPVAELTLELDGDDVSMSYRLADVPFERIRRITGYLVGTMDRWNNAKTAEEAERVKHDVLAKTSHMAAYPAGSAEQTKRAV